MNHFEYKTLKDLPSELVRFEIVPFSKINPNDYMTISIRGVTHYSNGELDYQESGKGSSWDQVIWKFDSVSETVAFLRTPIPPAFKVCINLGNNMVERTFDVAQKFEVVLLRSFIKPLSYSSSMVRVFAVASGCPKPAHDVVELSPTPTLWLPAAYGTASRASDVFASEGLGRLATWSRHVQDNRCQLQNMPLKYHLNHMTPLSGRIGLCFYGRV